MSQPTVDIHELMARREMMALLVEQYYPAHLPIYRTISGTYTGEQMAAEIREGSEVGRKYAQSLLEVCRDLLARQAQREQAKADEVMNTGQKVY